MKTIGNVQQDAQIRAVASGTLSNGDTVIIKSDGTVEAVSETIVNPAFGSKAQFESGNTSQHASAYDSTNNKVVFVYSDDDNNNYGTACVGDVDPSNNSISFGTPVVFQGAAALNNRIGATFDSNAGKIVISYQGTSNYGTAIVGTVSGTSISFGTPVVFESANTYEPLIDFDTNTNKCLIMYNKNSAFGEAIVGTVSGTSISFGSPATFWAYNCSNYDLAYDSNATRFLLAFRDDNQSDGYGKGVVATISGTSVNFSTVVQFTASSTWDTACSYDSDNQVVLVFYRNAYSSDYCQATIGTISGNAVSFSTPDTVISSNLRNLRAVYDPVAQKTILGFRENVSPRYGQLKPITLSGTTFTVGSTATFNAAQTTDFSEVYASSDGRVVFGFKDGGNGGRGNAIVYNAGSITRNLTSDNFIGFSDSGYLSGQNVGVDSTCSVNREQTGLTAGEKYYVQNDGSLSTTPDTPSVEAGTAISSTEILVKG